MSNFPESYPSLTEKLTARKVLRAIGAGISLFGSIINSICIAAIFIYIGSTIPALRPYAGYVAFYTLGARTIFLVGAFLAGCYWCCLRLVAPKQGGSSIKKWYMKLQETTSPKDGKLNKAGRRYYVFMGVLNTVNGLGYMIRAWKEPEFIDRFLFVLGFIMLLTAARSFYFAYVGRVPVPRKKGDGGENMTVGNEESAQLVEVTPVGEYTTTQ